MLFIPDTVQTHSCYSPSFASSKERKAETISEVLNHNPAPGYVSEHRSFEVSVNC